MAPSPIPLREVAITNALRSCQLFAGLPAMDLQTIASMVVLKNLVKGDYLFHEGEISHGFYSEDLTLKDVETRLANWLLKRCSQPISADPVSIEQKTTKRVLAAELGTVSETFSRTLAKFRDQNLVQGKGRSITLLDPAALQGLLRHHLGEVEVQTRLPAAGQRG